MGRASVRRYWERRVLDAWHREESELRSMPYSCSLSPDDYVRVGLDALEIHPVASGPLVSSITDDYEEVALDGADEVRLARWLVRRVRG